VNTYSSQAGIKCDEWRRGEEKRRGELKERATTSDQREGENNARESAYEECSFIEPIVQYESTVC
jgi:hypothetical protein